jgi:hypothetical protein
VRRIGTQLLAILLLGLAVTPAWAHGFRRADSRIEPAESAVEVVVASPTFARTPDAARLELSAGQSPAGRSGVGSAEVAGVLIATLGFAGLGRSWRRERRMAVATATAALVLGFIVETTPHLVHHTLDPDKGAGCEVLQTAERSQAAFAALDTTPVPAPARLIDTQSTVSAPTLAAPAARGRAPPA